MPPSTTDQNALRQKLDLLTGQCVMCAICLPHCPTYGLTQDENESPRGRISLIRALSQQAIEFDAELDEHLSQCLTCRACEKVCPSQVAYGEIIDNARELLVSEQGVTQPQDSESLLTSPNKRQWARKLIYWGQKSGVLDSSLVNMALPDSWRKKVALLPPISAPQAWQESYPAIGKQIGRVGLFIGCASDLFDQQTLADSIEVVQRLGFEVVVPKTQSCCGALSHHQGNRAKAVEHAQKNLAAFTGLDTILSTATGCTIELADYKKLLDNSLESQQFSQHTQDINQFILSQLGGSSSLPIAALDKTVALHTPCTMANTLNQEQAPFAMLSHIPQLKVLDLPENGRCCGAAGNYMLEHEVMANELVQPKIDAILHSGVDTLLTTNVGCALHIGQSLKKALQEKGQTITIMHPVSLLKQQLVSAS